MKKLRRKNSKLFIQMTKDNFIRELYKNLSEKHTLKHLTIIVDEIFDIMAEKLKKGEEVQLSDF